MRWCWVEVTCKLSQGCVQGWLEVAPKSSWSRVAGECALTKNVHGAWKLSQRCVEVELKEVASIWSCSRIEVARTLPTRPDASKIAPVQKLSQGCLRVERRVVVESRLCENEVKVALRLSCSRSKIELKSSCELNNRYRQILVLRWNSNQGCVEAEWNSLQYYVEVELRLRENEVKVACEVDLKSPQN